MGTTHTPNNDQRAHWGGLAVRAYEQSHRVNPDMSVQDLITDLLHLAAKQGLVPEDVARRALVNFEAEVADQEGITINALTGEPKEVSERNF
jgi:hypothetical protein